MLAVDSGASATCRCERCPRLGSPHTDPSTGSKCCLGGLGGRETARQEEETDTGHTIAGECCGHRGSFSLGPPGRRQHVPLRARTPGYCQDSNPRQSDPRIQSTFVLNVGIPFRMCELDCLQRTGSSPPDTACRSHWAALTAPPCPHERFPAPGGALVGERPQSRPWAHRWG